MGAPNRDGAEPAPQQEATPGGRSPSLPGAGEQRQGRGQQDQPGEPIGLVLLGLVGVADQARRGGGKQQHNRHQPPWEELPGHMPQQHQDSDARQQRHQPLAVLVVAEQADKAVLQPQPADRRAAWLSASGRSSPRKPREPMFSATMASSSHRERRKAYWRTRTTTPSTTIAAASQSR